MSDEAVDLDAFEGYRSVKGRNNKTLNAKILSLLTYTIESYRKDCIRIVYGYLFTLRCHRAIQLANFRLVPNNNAQMLALAT